MLAASRPPSAPFPVTALTALTSSRSDSCGQFCILNKCSNSSGRSSSNNTRVRWCLAQLAPCRTAEIWPCCRVWSKTVYAHRRLVFHGVPVLGHIYPMHFSRAPAAGSVYWAAVNILCMPFGNHVCISIDSKPKGRINGSYSALVYPSKTFPKVHLPPL